MLGAPGALTPTLIPQGRAKGPRRRRKARGFAGVWRLGARTRQCNPQHSQHDAAARAAATRASQGFPPSRHAASQWARPAANWRSRLDRRYVTGAESPPATLPSAPEAPPPPLSAAAGATVGPKTRSWRARIVSTTPVWREEETKALMKGSFSCSSCTKSCLEGRDGAAGGAVTSRRAKLGAAEATEDDGAGPESRRRQRDEGGARIGQCEVAVAAHSWAQGQVGRRGAQRQAGRLGARRGEAAALVEHWP